MAVKERDFGGQYDLSTRIKSCSKCTVSNQSPGITFVEDWVCLVCGVAECKRQRIDWQQRKHEPFGPCNRYGKSNGMCAIIVPCGGDKDGSLSAHSLKCRYSKNPLVLKRVPREDRVHEVIDSWSCDHTWKEEGARWKMRKTIQEECVRSS